MAVIRVVVMAVHQVKFILDLYVSTIGANRIPRRLQGYFPTAPFAQIRLLLDSLKVVHADSEEVSEIAEDIFPNPRRHLDDIRVIVLQDVTSPYQTNGHFDHPSHVKFGDERNYV